MEQQFIKGYHEKGKGREEGNVRKDVFERRTSTEGGLLASLGSGFS